MKSIFTDKSTTPTIAALQNCISDTYTLWQELEMYTMQLCPKATGEWNYGGDKYGWSYRVIDKKRVLVYLLPRDRFFKVALVFSNKAVEAITQAPVADSIKTQLCEARPYAEGRGIRIDVTSATYLSDIKLLIGIKIDS